MTTNPTPRGRPLGELTLAEQRAYWADAAEACRDILRAEHTTRSPESLHGLLRSIGRYAALAEDPGCMRRADWRLVVPDVEAVLAEPLRPCRFRTAATAA